MTYSRILGTGGYLPEKILSNADLEEMVETNDDWIVERTGIKYRHIAGENENTATMATFASKAAIKAAGMAANDIDMIIVATCTSDQQFPGTAAYLQKNLGIAQCCPAFDVSAACSGFIYALSIADSCIRSGTIRNALVVGSEAMSKIVDWTDRRTCILFGDGAGAVVIGKSEKPGILSTVLHSDGQYTDLLYATKGEPIQMQGNEVFKLAVRKLGDVVDETLSKAQLKQTDLDWLVPHQANLRIIKATAKKLGLPLEQVILTVAEHGNTSAASIPLALDCAVRDGRIKEGQHILLEAFGGGMAWGAALVRM